MEARAHVRIFIKTIWAVKTYIFKTFINIRFERENVVKSARKTLRVKRLFLCVVVLGTLESRWHLMSPWRTRFLPKRLENIRLWISAPPFSCQLLFEWKTRAPTNCTAALKTTQSLGRWSYFPGNSVLHLTLTYPFHVGSNVNLKQVFFFST